MLASALKHWGVKHDGTVVFEGERAVLIRATAVTGEAMSRTHRPLSDVRILDLTRALAGPYGTALLADLGADVVKIEPPSGDSRARWRRCRRIALRRVRRAPATVTTAGISASINRKRRSIVLDLKKEADRAVFLDLVDDRRRRVEKTLATELNGPLGVDTSATRRNPGWSNAPSRLSAIRRTGKSHTPTGPRSTSSPSAWAGSSATPPITAAASRRGERRRHLSRDAGRAGASSQGRSTQRGHRPGSVSRRLHGRSRSLSLSDGVINHTFTGTVLGPRGSGHPRSAVRRLRGEGRSGGIAAPTDKSLGGAVAVMSEAISFSRDERRPFPRNRRAPRTGRSSHRGRAG